MVALIVGVVLLLICALVWAGPLRGAVDTPLWPFGWFSIVPGFALMLVAAGPVLLGVVSDDSPLVPVGMLCALTGVVLFVWEPHWWGPRWYKERRR